MGKRVLVADDNRDAADSLVVLLDWLGYEAYGYMLIDRRGNCF